VCGKLAGDTGNSRSELTIEGVPVENLMGRSGGERCSREATDLTKPDVIRQC